MAARKNSVKKKPAKKSPGKNTAKRDDDKRLKGAPCTRTKQVEKTVNELILDGIGLPRGKGQIRYTREIGAEICARLASGESMHKICKDAHMPHKSSVNRWLIFADDEHIHKSKKLRSELVEFREHYNNARSIQAEHFFDLIPDIAQDGKDDYECRVTKNGGEYIMVNKEHIMRSKLSVETLKWLSEVYLPKVQALRNQNISLTGKQPLVLQFDKQDEEA